MKIPFKPYQKKILSISTHPLKLTKHVRNDHTQFIKPPVVPKWLSSSFTYAEFSGQVPEDQMARLGEDTHCHLPQ